MRSMCAAIVFLEIGFLLSGGALFAAEPRWKLNVWPGTAPGEKNATDPDEVNQPPAGTKNGVIRITKVTVPQISVFTPDDKKRNGAAVIVCPGGGYHILAYDKEGTEVAHWLNTLGVTAIVLKYRVPRRNEGLPQVAALQDVQRAIRLVRSHADEWQIDQQRLGVLGFSAGGHLTVMAGTTWSRNAYEPIDKVDQLNARPDFLVPIYAAYLSDGEKGDRLSDSVQINKQTPPMFLAVSANDKRRAVDAARLFIALKDAGVKGELHIYSDGGHGYGLRTSPFPAHTWPARCGEWMAFNGLLTRKE